MAILFKSTAASVARWRPHLSDARLARARPALLAAGRRQGGDRICPRMASRAGAAREPSQFAADPVAGRRGRPHPARPRAAGGRADRAPRRSLHDAGDERIRRKAPGAARSLHRQDFAYRAQQATAEWRELAQKNAAERTVGILGFGQLGQDAAATLKALGFDVAGWNRSGRDVPGFRTYGGAAGFDALLRRSEILVSLLPMTPETEGILNADLFGAGSPHGAGARQCRARPAARRGRPVGGARVGADFRPRCSTCLRRSRCPLRILFGVTRVSSSHRISRPRPIRQPPRRSSPRRSRISRPADRSTM